jgi:hypothetical protein
MLRFSMLYTKDRNDSLKRVRGQGPVLHEASTDGQELQPSNEHIDTWTCGEEYFLGREVVDALGRGLVAVPLANDDVSGSCMCTTVVTKDAEYLEFQEQSMCTKVAEHGQRGYS